MKLSANPSPCAGETARCTASKIQPPGIDMSNRTGEDSPVHTLAPETLVAPTTRIGRWKTLGPGIVVAATSIGSADLIASSVAGSKFGYQLLWAIVVGCILKAALTEAVGRWHLVGGTMFSGWRQLGRWTTWYFGIFIVVFGLALGAVNMAATALPLNELFPALSVPVWGILCGLLGLTFVMFNKYALFERVMTVLVGFMFVTIVGLALIMAPDLGAMGRGLLPTIPEGAGSYTLAIAGGVGGSITVVSYGYWITAKGWRGPSWIQSMRLDNRVAYVMIGLTSAAMMVFGVALLQLSPSVSGNPNQWLSEIRTALSDRYGAAVGTWFVVGFFATSVSTLLGIWNGVSLVVTDFIRETWLPELATDRPERSTPFRLYAAWLTFPPMLILFVGKPVQLVIAFGVMGASFLPFLAITLLLLLNSKSIPKQFRNGAISNTILAAGGLLLLYLFAVEVIGYLPGQ